MKLTCTQSELNTNLSLVSRVVPSRPTHPILGNVLFVADAETQKVTLTAFDLSLGIQTSFAAVVETSGKLTIPAKLLSDIVSRLSAGEITLSDTVNFDAEAGHLVTLISASGRYQMRGMSADEFPALPQVQSETAISLPVEALKQGLGSTLFATSPDETKQVLTGVHLTVGQDGIEFAATDGHRLAVVETKNLDEDNQEIEPFQVTVPTRALKELERMIATKQPTDAVMLYFEQGQLVFQEGEQRLTTRTLEGTYPAYRQLIPVQFQRQLTIDRKQLLGAVERIGVLADQKNNTVKFSIDSTNQQLSLSVEAQDVGSGQESMPIQATGDDLLITFNVKYLIDGLKTLATTEIQMLINTADTPVILVPLGELKMTYLIMPVQIIR
jgi:DNA polymerase-3 subunit beta